jgi:hypothetical protein
VISIGQEIGTEPILPYLSPELKGDKLLVGANFASAGVGILNDTGFQFVGENDKFCSINIKFMHTLLLLLLLLLFMNTIMYICCR